MQKAFRSIPAYLALMVGVALSMQTVVPAGAAESDTHLVQGVVEFPEGFTTEVIWVGIELWRYESTGPVLVKSGTAIVDSLTTGRFSFARVAEGDYAIGFGSPFEPIFVSESGTVHALRPTDAGIIPMHVDADLDLGTIQMRRAARHCVTVDLTSVSDPHWGVDIVTFRSQDFPLRHHLERRADAVWSSCSVSAGVYRVAIIDRFDYSVPIALESSPVTGPGSEIYVDADVEVESRRLPVIEATTTPTPTPTPSFTEVLDGQIPTQTTSGSSPSVVPTVVVPVPVIRISRPRIAGVAKVGRTLRAEVATRKPSSATLTFQWYRDGVRISGQTASRLRLTKSTAGHTVTVRVTARAVGRQSISVMSHRMPVAPKRK